MYDIFKLLYIFICNVFPFVWFLLFFLFLFLLCLEEEIIFPLRTAFAASQSTDGEISGVLFSAIKDVHSLERRLVLESLSAIS